MSQATAELVRAGLKNNPRRWRMSRGYFHNQDLSVVLHFQNLPRYDVSVITAPGGAATIPPGIAKKLIRDINWWRTHGPFEKRRGRPE